MTWRERQPLASLRRSLGLDTTPLKRLRADRTDAIDYVANLSCIDLSRTLYVFARKNGPLVIVVNEPDNEQKIAIDRSAQYAQFFGFKLLIAFVRIYPRQYYPGAVASATPACAFDRSRALLVTDPLIPDIGYAPFQII